MSVANGDGPQERQTTEFPVLEVSNLHKTFGKRSALRGVSLEVAPGELYGLVGPDGAGKTTSIRILAGVMAPSTGEARILGMNPMSSSPKVRNAVGYMPQQYSLYGDLTVDENLTFFARMFCLSRADFRERRERLLSITRLARFSDRRADALSGGMYKKLALACSLLPRPRALLLDEPTNGVDPVSRRDLWALLFEFCSEGMAVLVSTAYMDEAVRCHRVGLIHEGRLVQEGPPSALLRDFPHSAFEVLGGDRDGAEALCAADETVLACSFSGARPRIVVESGRELGLQQKLETTGSQLAPATPDFEDLFLVSTKTGRMMELHE